MLSSAKKWALAGAVAGWFALLLQLYLIYANRVAGVTETIVRYFSFFTILSNIIVAVSLTMVYKKGINAAGSFFTKPGTLTATAVYITVVGLIYNVILRFLWVPQGWDRVADEMLHSVIPVWYIVFWLKFVPKQTIQWKNISAWLIYPLVYLGYTLLRGSFVNWYPYPFINVTAIGYSKAFINSAMVTLVFVVICILFVGTAKWHTNKSRRK